MDQFKVGRSYQVSTKIGSGAFGEIYIGTFFLEKINFYVANHVKTGMEVAVKMVSLNRLLMT